MDTKSAGFSLLSKSMQREILEKQAEQPQVEPEVESEVKLMSNEDYWAQRWEESLNEDDGANEVRMRASDFPRRRRGLEW